VYIHLAACWSCSCRPPLCTRCVLDRRRQRPTREPRASMSMHEIVVPPLRRRSACSCWTAVCHRFFVVVATSRTHLAYAVVSLSHRQCHSSRLRGRFAEQPSAACMSSPSTTVSRMNVFSVVDSFGCLTLVLRSHKK
jgi:hypothetical protein